MSAAVSPFTCFSIEPGIYLPEFGVRSEINMYVGEGEAVVTGRDPARDGPALMPAQALAVVATLISCAPHGNRIDMNSTTAAPRLVWISPASFHFRRTLDGPLPAGKAEAPGDTVDFRMTDGPDAVRLRSKKITVTDPQARRAGKRRSGSMARR